MYQFALLRRRHRRCGPLWPRRRGAPLPAGLARRRAVVERQLRHDAAARGGAQRPRGGLPRAAGGQGRGGRRNQQMLLGRNLGRKERIHGDPW